MDDKSQTFTVLTAHHALCNLSCQIPADLLLNRIFVNRQNNCMQYPELSNIVNQSYEKVKQKRSATYSY